MTTITVNALGDQCPIPVVKTIKAMGRMSEAGVVETLVDNEVAVQNLTKLAKSKGLAVSREKLEEKRFAVRITVEDPSVVGGDTSSVNCQLELFSLEDSSCGPAHPFTVRVEAYRVNFDCVETVSHGFFHCFCVFFRISQ